MKKNNKDKKNVFARLDKNIPMQKKALDNLGEYQQQTGLTQKDALVFILSQLNLPFLNTEIQSTEQVRTYGLKPELHKDPGIKEKEGMTEEEARSVQRETASCEQEHDDQAAGDKEIRSGNINDFLTENFDYD